MLLLYRWRALPTLFVLLAVTAGCLSAVTREELVTPLETCVQHFWQIEADDSDETAPSGESLLKKFFEIATVPVPMESLPVLQSMDDRLFVAEVLQSAPGGTLRDIFIPPERDFAPA